MIYHHYKTTKQALSSLDAHAKETGQRKTLISNMVMTVIPNVLSGLILLLSVVLYLIHDKEEWFYFVLISISDYAICNPIIYTFNTKDFRKYISQILRKSPGK